MKTFFIRLGLYSLAFYASAYIFKGVYLHPAWSAFLMALAFSFLNQWIKPLLTFIALPITCLTLGLFQLAVNLIILILADWLVPGFELKDLLSAFILTLALMIFNVVISQWVPDES